MFKISRRKQQDSSMSKNSHHQNQSPDYMDLQVQYGRRREIGPDRYPMTSGHMMWHLQTHNKQINLMTLKKNQNLKTQ